MSSNIIAQLKLNEEYTYELIEERDTNKNNLYNVLLELCLDSNFEDRTLSDKTKLSQKERFNILIESKQIDFNYITYKGTFIGLTNNEYFIDKLLKKGLDINLIFEKDQTILSKLMYTILGISKYVNMYKTKYFNKFKYLLNKGADINKGNLRIISGVQYENRPQKVEFIKYLIDNGLDTHNRLLSTHKLVTKQGKVDFMLYNTRLGKIICPGLPGFCDNCGLCDIYEKMVHMDNLKEKNAILYPESSFAYCHECWNKKNLYLKCEKCHKDYQTYICEKDGKLLINQSCGQVDEKETLRVCYNCKCDGADCEYC